MALQYLFGIPNHQDDELTRIDVFPGSQSGTFRCHLGYTISIFPPVFTGAFKKFILGEDIHSLELALEPIGKSLNERILTGF